MAGLGGDFGRLVGVLRGFGAAAFGRVTLGGGHWDCSRDGYRVGFGAFVRMGDMVGVGGGWRQGARVSNFELWCV